MKPKVVFDTNIFISAIIFGGNPRTCLELARRHEIELFTSSEILLEITQKLKRKFEWSDDEIIDVVSGLAKFSHVVKPGVKISIIKEDPTDNKILECAVCVNADFVASGDKKHVLPVLKYENIKILSAKDFLDEYYRE